MSHLTTAELAALRWAIGEAETWRGALSEAMALLRSDAEEDERLARFDPQVVHAKNAMKKVRTLHRAEKARSYVGSIP